MANRLLHWESLRVLWVESWGQFLAMLEQYRKWTFPWPVSQRAGQRGHKLPRETGPRLPPLAPWLPFGVGRKRDHGGAKTVQPSRIASMIIITDTVRSLYTSTCSRLCFGAADVRHGACVVLLFQVTQFRSFYGRRGQTIHTTIHKNKNQQRKKWKFLLYRTSTLASTVVH
jgi:hypothetical protein